jgi:hypothetical protein
MLYVWRLYQHTEVRGGDAICVEAVSIHRGIVTSEDTVSCKPYSILFLNKDNLKYLSPPNENNACTMCPRAMVTSVGWLFTVLRPAHEFFTYMETSPLQVKGCKI